MSPIDPATTVSSSDRSPMDNPFIEENPNLVLVEQGMEVADDEARDAVTEAYEKEAIAGDESEDALDDIEYTPDDDEAERPPEVAAIHESPPE